MRRLLAYLLLLCLAAPALGAPAHCLVPQAGAQHVANAGAQHKAKSGTHHASPRDDRRAPPAQHHAPPGKDCIGCVTPWRAPDLLPAAHAPPRLALTVGAPRPLAALRAAPDTPPPRS
jgi:hypothetical protein